MKNLVISITAASLAGCGMQQISEPSTIQMPLVSDETKDSAIAERTIALKQRVAILKLRAICVIEFSPRSNDIENHFVAFSSADFARVRSLRDQGLNTEQLLNGESCANVGGTLPVLRKSVYEKLADTLAAHSGEYKEVEVRFSNDQQLQRQLREQMALP